MSETIKSGRFSVLRTDSEEKSFCSNLTSPMNESFTLISFMSSIQQQEQQEFSGQPHLPSSPAERKRLTELISLPQKCVVMVIPAVAKKYISINDNRKTFFIPVII